MEIDIRPLEAHCANRQCTNRINEGKFAEVKVGVLITLVMCTPCAEKIRRSMDGLDG